MKYVQVKHGDVRLYAFASDRELQPIGYCFTAGKLHFGCRFDYKTFGANGIDLENQELMGAVFQAWRRRGGVIDRLSEAELIEFKNHLDKSPLHVSLLYADDGTSFVISETYRQMAVVI